MSTLVIEKNLLDLETEKPSTKRFNRHTNR